MIEFVRAIERRPWLGWVVVALSLVLGAVLLAPPSAAQNETPVTEGTATGDEDTVADDEREIQILTVERSSQDAANPDLVRMEVAIPPSIAAQHLDESHFGLTVNGQLVNTFEAARLDDRVDVVLVIDTSGSMQGRPLGDAKTASRRFLSDVPAEARVGLVSFGATAQVVSEPSLDREALGTTIGGLRAEGDTAMWDGLVVAADLLDENGSSPAASAPTTGRDRSSYVVVLADGADTVSLADADQAISRLRAAGVALYSVAIESEEADGEALAQVTAAVGGRFFSTGASAQLSDLYAGIAARLNSRYVITFDVDPLVELGPVVVSVADDGALATAAINLSTAPEAAAGSGGGAGADPEAGDSPLPQYLNADEARLGDAAPREPSLIQLPIMRTLGIGAIALALLLFGLVLLPSPGTVQIGTAAGADRVSGVGQRLSGVADQLIARRDQEGELNKALDVAGINLRPGEFLLLAAGVVVILALALSMLGGSLLGVVGAAAGVVGVGVYLSRRAERRRQRFADQLTETLGVMAGALRAGRGLSQTIELVAAEAPSPTAEQFKRIMFEVRVGRDVTEAMLDVADRMRSQDFEWVAKAVAINRELGGNLTEVLDNVADTIRERQRLTRMVRSLSAEGRASGWVLLALPVVMFAFVAWRTPENASVMVGTGMGRIMLAIGLGGMIVGYVWIRRLLDLKY